MSKWNLQTRKRSHPVVCVCGGGGGGGGALRLILVGSFVYFPTSCVLSIGQAKSSIPALSYFQAGGMKHDQELCARVSYPPHRAPVGAVCEGSSMRTCRYA